MSKSGHHIVKIFLLICKFETDAAYVCAITSFQLCHKTLVNENSLEGGWILCSYILSLIVKSAEYVGSES